MKKIQKNIYSLQYNQLHSGLGFKTHTIEKQWKKQWRKDKNSNSSCIAVESVAMWTRLASGSPGNRHIGHFWTPASTTSMFPDNERNGHQILRYTSGYLFPTRVFQTPASTTSRFCVRVCVCCLEVNISTFYSRQLLPQFPGFHNSRRARVRSLEVYISTF